MYLDLRHGDSSEVLKLLPDNSVDSIVTDPPAGIGFAGEHWDSYSAPEGSRNPARDGFISAMAQIFAECLRVLKPGGHALVWAIPRTSHWTAMALEDAGFEIRDRVGHLFGSGFPKSHNIALAIDKLHGAPNRGREIPVATQSRKKSDGVQVLVANPVEVYEPVTEAGAAWDDWGTGLKPACEDWWLCRKPLDGTIADNVLKHGTGGLNVGATRIPNSAGLDRWPAHLVHDGSPEVESVFPAGEARYFYCSKIGKKDRDEGLDAFEERSSYMVANGANRDTAHKNPHPTPKSLELMLWLCQLITPPGGVILDPFMGSGSTGKAAVFGGFGFVGIEREEEYFKVAEARIKHAQEEKGGGILNLFGAG